VPDWTGDSLLATFGNGVTGSTKQGHASDSGLMSVEPLYK
jgi:hypothetical protein